MPAEVHDGLTRNAQERGQSLSEYLRDELGRLVRRPTFDEIQAEIETWPRSGPLDVVGALHEGRSERER